MALKGSLLLAPLIIEKALATSRMFDVTFDQRSQELFVHKFDRALRDLITGAGNSVIAAGDDDKLRCDPEAVQLLVQI